ncbi:MAG: response regulator transcription factor, partial [Chloroflexi bacterium]|nr:response regulator transcription factor [Chloroflexota bacterium]
MTEEAFSTREKDVIELLLQGKSNKQIALALHVANRTVEFHLSNIYAKLGVTSRTEAVLKLSETGLRESTGEAGSGNMRESTVEKNDKAADNGSYAANDGSKSFSL